VPISLPGESRGRTKVLSLDGTIRVGTVKYSSVWQSKSVIDTVCLCIYTGSMKTRKSLFVDDDQWRRLKALSEKTLAPVSALVRKAIEEFLKKQKA
jgi:hypothetical protein